jgi:hypothetical protein
MAAPMNSKKKCTCGPSANPHREWDADRCINCDGVLPKAKVSA